MKLPSALFSLPLFALVFAGCQRYSFYGIHDPEQIKSIVIAPIDNQSNDPSLTTFMQNKLSELFMLDGSMNVVDSGDADYVLQTKIVAYDLSGIGEQKIRSREDDQRTFRSIIFEVKVHLEYRLVPSAQDGSAAVKSGVVTGVADFTELIDMDIVRRDGLRKATYNGCDRLVASIVDYW